MGDDNDFFAVPPQSNDHSGGDAAILLGDASNPPTDGYDDLDAFASAPPLVLVPEPGGDEGMNDPTYLGEVNEAPDSADAPIIMGMDDPNSADGNVSTTEDAMMTVPVETEPTGPTPMQKWNDEWQETLKARKEIENSRRAELVDAARVALEEYTAGREVKRQTKMTSNRQDEQAKLEAIEADLENDNSWQRVCKMIEFSHDSTHKAADIKRMRDILILLKNDPSRADTLTA